ncbi:hypothetical protein O6H91_11G013900 [Diphasiastrum complanatum]|nr:hypothetical protein O6H91_11G013900 [Diphasiastrum complanatum]
MFLEDQSSFRIGKGSRTGYSSKKLENIEVVYALEQTAKNLEVERKSFSVQCQGGVKSLRDPNDCRGKSTRTGSCKDVDCSVVRSKQRRIRLGKEQATLKGLGQTIRKVNALYAKNAGSQSINLARSLRRSRMLQTIQTVLVVSKDGHPDHFPSIQSAVDAVPMWNYLAWIIYIKPGWYHEAVVVPEGKDYITFLGEGAETTVIVYNRKASEVGPNGTEYGILNCASVIIGGSHFTAKGITFMNESPKPDDMDFESQAPAIRISGDKCAFYSCTFLGWQDTLFADQGRHYYKNCRIEGSVDFILGYAKAVFDNCTIHSRDQGFISAQSRWCDSDCIGAGSAFIFLRCNLSGIGPTYLGRPWRPYARVIFIDTYMGPHILPEGWIDWLTEMGPLFPHDNVYFAEFGSKGPGSNPDARVSWSHQLTEMDIIPYWDWRSFLEGDGWLEAPPNLKQILDSNLLRIPWSPPISQDESQPMHYPRRRWKNLGGGQSDP